MILAGLYLQESREEGKGRNFKKQDLSIIIYLFVGLQKLF